MAWENRSGNRYYYRKRRIGRQVVSEYIGAGLDGEQAAEDDAQARQELQLQREQRRQAEQLDADLRQADELTRALVNAALLLAGYHPHKRTWRRRRDVK